jgi:truncated hemoglobin YjbI
VPTLFEWAGGEEALGRLLNAFYDRVEDDELLSGFFPGGVSKQHRDHVTAWWVEVFGGPARYSEQLGGYEHMVEKHRPRDHSRAAASLRVPSEPRRRRRRAVRPHHGRLT